VSATITLARAVGAIFTPEVGLGDHAAINGFDFRRLPTHHRDSEAARDLLRADGVQHKVGGFDRAATLDTVLRAYVMQQGLLRRLTWPAKSPPED
jgi:hypothetical protein